MSNIALAGHPSPNNLTATLASINATALLSLSLIMAIVSITSWFRILTVSWLFLLEDQYLAVQLLLLGALAILLYGKAEPRNVLFRAFLLNLLLCLGNSSIMFLFK